MISKEKQKCESMILFGNLDQGKILNCKFYSVIDQRFPEKRLVGRNKQLHDLFILLKGSSKVIKLEGPKGTGKTVLARQLANYLYARNHFRYKIAAIELSTISTVSGLLSKIFSEIGVINDLNSFCEAVRSKEVLYILDNCDSFIEHNRVEFSKSLRNLISSTKNVKFLIIITKSFDLELQEASLKLDALLPTHAAKLLLLSTPIDKILPMKYRSVEVLKNAPLFKQTGVKISIQTLLWISQRLMQGHDFETVQKELLSTFQSGTTEEQSKILIEATLNQIQHENAEACKLIKMINTFEGGLSYLDLQEMAELGIISIEWIAILLNLVSYKANAKHYEESEESSGLASDENLSKNRPQKIRFKPGYYFWFKIAITKEDYPLFEPIESVREVLYQKIDLDLLSYETKKFEYLTLLSLSLLQKLKKTNSYSEKVIENSAVSDYGIWKINPNNAVYIDFARKILKIDYLDEEKSYNRSNELETVFKLHEKNFRSVFSLPILKALVANQGSREKMTDLIEVLFFTIPTLFKIILGCSESAVSLTSEALNCLNELDLKEARIAILKIKLHLLIIAITITQRNEAKQIEQIINSEIQLLEMSKRELKDDKLLQRIDFEIEISRAKFFHKAHNGRYKISNMLTEEMSPQPSFKYLSHLENQLENQCPKILKYLTDTEVEQAKLSLLIYDAYSEKAETLRNEEKVRDDLSEAIRVFNKYHCKKLELKTHLLMATLYLRYLSLSSHDLLKMEFIRAYIEKKNTSSPQILIKESTLLGKIRKYHLKQGALHLAQQIRDLKSLTKANFLINAFNLELRQSLFNMIVFLNSEPTLLNLEENYLPQLGQKDYNPQISIPIFFKSEVLDVLSKREKVLNVKFEILTKQSLEEALNSGCRILYLGTEISCEEGIIVEDSYSKPVLIQLEELKQLFADSKVKRESLFSDNLATTEHKIEVLILDSRNSSRLANYFVDELKIPHVICFEFETPKKLDFKRRLYEKEYCSKFVQFFLNELVSGMSVKKSFHNAVRDTLECLSYSFFNLAEETELINYLGRGAVLMPEYPEKDHESDHKHLFGKGEFILQNGKIEDLSLQRFHTNIHKSIVPFFGRAREMSQIMEFLTGDPEKMNGFLKLTGEAGVGKTRLALEIGWYLVQRHLFPHGIFYIPMRKLKKMNIYDLIEKTSQKIGFGSDKNYANFFRNKKMLLILDDFDILYSGQNEIPSLVLTMIKKSKTSVIVITTKYELKETLDDASQTFQKQFLEIQSRIESEFVAKSFTLKRLEPNHVANIMLSLTSTSFKEGLSYDDALMHPILLKARGIPAKIVEVINEKKLIHQGMPLEMFPYYIPFQKLTKRYRHYFKTGRDLPETERKIFALSISRHCRSFKEEAEKMMNDFASDIKERASLHDKINLKNTDIGRSISQPMLPHKKVAFMLTPELSNTSEIKEAASKDFYEEENVTIPEKSVETGSLNEIKEPHSIKFRRSVSEKLHSNEDENETE